MASRTVGVAEAKKSLSSLLGRVSRRGESFVIQKRGTPVARLVPMDGAPRSGLADVRGWLKDGDPFLAVMEEITAARHARRPRSAPVARRRSR
jgi:prevent-host-death family protein